MTFFIQLERCYGRRTRLEVRKLDHDLVRLANSICHINFLRRCQQNSVMPNFLRLPRRLGAASDAIIGQCERRLLSMAVRKQFAQRAWLQRQVDQRRRQLGHVVRDEPLLQLLDQGRQQLFDSTLNTCHVRHVTKFTDLFLAVPRVVEASQGGAHHHRPHPAAPFPMPRFVDNRSAHVLSVVEEMVLRKGLNFAPAHNRVPYADLITSADLLAKRLATQPGGREVAQRFVTDVAQLLQRSRPPPPNLSSEEWGAIKNLKANDNIVICRADKGNCTVILDKADYVAKCKALLDDRATYALPPLRSNSTPQTRVNTMGEELNTRLRQLVLEGKVTEEEKAKMMCHWGVPSRFYGLPKVHKPTLPIRPIVSAINSFVDRLASHLKPILQPLVGTSPTFIKDSHHFVARVRQLQLNSADLLVSFDVTSLFTRVPIDQSIRVICERLRADGTLATRTSMSAETVAELLGIVLRSCYFVFGGQWYRQVEGAAMGGRLSPLVAELFMDHFETTLLPRTSLQPREWWRYVDDTFVIWPHGRTALNDHLAELNNLHPAIELTMEVESSGQLPFLDVSVSRESGQYVTAVYRKPTHTDRYLHFESAHAFSTRLGIVRTLNLRNRRISTKQGAFEAERAHLRKVFAANGYPSVVIERGLLLPPANRPQPPRPQPAATWSVPYVAGLAQRLERLASRYHVQTRFTANRTIGSLISKLKDPVPLGSQTGSVYTFACGCGKAYIGESTRPLHCRIREHTKDLLHWRTNKSAAAAHRANECPGGVAPNPEGAQILLQDKYERRLQTKEGLLIKAHHPQLFNQDTGTHTAEAWVQFGRQLRSQYQLP